jgi:hypothetical protein
VTRTWRTSAGDYLVEGDSAHTTTGGYPIRDGGDVPITGAYTYWLLDSSRNVRDVYDSHTGAIDDYLYGSAFLVVGDALHAYYTEYHTAVHDVDEHGIFNRRNTDRIVHDGLIDVSLASAIGVETDSEAAEVFAAARSRWRRREEAERSEAGRPVLEFEASFDAVLPMGEVDLVFGYDTGPHVRRPDGTVIWRPPTTWPYRGKDMYWTLRRVLDRRWGTAETIRRMPLDVAAAPWWFWDPNE